MIYGRWVFCGLHFGELCAAICLVWIRMHMKLRRGTTEFRTIARVCLELGEYPVKKLKYFQKE